MSEVDFNSILDTNVEDIKQRPPLPVGTYAARIAKIEPGKFGQKKTDGVEFTFVPYDAKEDVDAQKLQEREGLRDTSLRSVFWITPDAAPMLKNFLIDMVGLEGSGKTMRQLLAEAPNQQVGIVVTSGITKDGREFAQIDRFCKL